MSFRFLRDFLYDNAIPRITNISLGVFRTLKAPVKLNKAKPTTSSRVSTGVHQVECALSKHQTCALPHVDETFITMCAHIFLYPAQSLFFPKIVLILLKY
jgi:hypothetical protein